ncbi:hypothetical protein T03_6799 [Trichinella britovi]|uniref:Uncharacterized protein n=2 Tax=Trichinella TaxID=6333 RepID=A0A0V1DBM9_TRIBR|nr:hypothetical protein T05_1007 [Trichinella murrelli]KRY58776.1 hypothetical protein T03_6799 [Trichinella britovi]KRZ96259.1 hypothetical protein T08_3361 [Trichinella sp. T8]
MNQLPHEACFVIILGSLNGHLNCPNCLVPDSEMNCLQQHTWSLACESTKRLKHMLALPFKICTPLHGGLTTYLALIKDANS